MLELNKIHQGDCMELMQHIPDKSVDMILCDLPYGTTACKWDKVLPLNELWKQYKRILKKDGVVVLTASQPFTTDLINSNRDWFKYEMIWDKKCITSPALAQVQPLRTHENILVFYNKAGKYNPLKITPKNTIGYMGKEKEYGNHKVWGYKQMRSKNQDNELGYPRSIISIRRKINLDKKTAFDVDETHPTEKPIELFKLLIKLFSNEGELVLDNCIGSGTTAVACKQTNRNFIGIELNPNYVDICNKRLKQKTMFEIAEKRDTLNSYMEVSADSSQP